MIDDNPYLSEYDKKDLIATFRGDPETVMTGMCLGSGQPPQQTLTLGKVFKYDTHVVGDANSPIESEWEVISCQPTNCTELIGGWDLGDRNHAFPYLGKGEHLEWGQMDSP